MSIHTKSIDLNYRPASYFWAREHAIPLASDIKGAVRRQLYEHHVQTGEFDVKDADLMLPSLTPEQRRAQGTVHPSLLGGEYLPDTEDGEVEIARIVIASVTMDVASVYARQVSGRIHYRVVDEYDGETYEGPPTCTSIKPLPLGRLVDFFLNCWRLPDTLTCIRGVSGMDRQDAHAFVVEASSSFYAEFGRLIHARVDEWADEVEQEEDQE